MHTIELSNHPGDMLDDVSRRRVAAEKRVLSGYEDELIRYRAGGLIQHDHALHDKQRHDKRRRAGPRPRR